MSTLDKNKKADIFQANFEHYYRMAMDHYTKAGTTSHILLGVVSAILIVIGYDKQLGGSNIDIICATMIIVIGFFGTVWAGRQMERYRFWEFIALKYQEELIKIMPELRKYDDYKPDKQHLDKDLDENRFFERCFLKPLWHFFAFWKDRYLWIVLHILIMLFGAVLLSLALNC